MKEKRLRRVNVNVCSYRFLNVNCTIELISICRNSILIKIIAGKTEKNCFRRVNDKFALVKYFIFEFRIRNGLIYLFVS